MNGAFRNRRALILGAGVSGVAAGRLIVQRGGRATVVDAGPASALTAAAVTLKAAGAALIAAADQLPDEPFDLCVASPSFPPDHPWMAAAASRGITIVSEMELGAACWPGRILAVTGSKGKSSVVKLCADTLSRAGVPAAPAGNYGTPLSALVLDAPELRWAVTEVSSFQLENVCRFRPQVAMLLNLQPDHLDRHASLEEYRGIKLRLFGRQGAGDVALLPEGFDAAGTIAPDVELLRFGSGSASDWRYQPGAVTGVWRGVPRSIAMSGTWFDNPVLGLAAAASAAALAACGLDDAAISAGLAAFEPLPHRMQHVRTLDGVRYVDDSKATSLAATAAALQMTAGRVRLIAGGRLKEDAALWPKELLTAKAEKVYLVGESAPSLAAAWSDAAPCEICGNVEAAVVAAAREAVSGETVLLSPGCASFDQFRSYKARGDCFARAVRALAGAPG